MQIIRLKIKNIASLKGEHEIDFQDIQKEGHLFAITGETGAGKSTILNSIGLALYGQIYKKNINQMDLVTLGERDGSIELIIQVKGKFYLAEWKAKVKKSNGEPYATPQPPTRNLYQLTNSDFNSNKTISTLRIEELLNLDFDQFCKCIILNQGEFSKFLTSSFSDRKDILEKLYSGEVIESMGKEIKIEVDALEKEKRETEIKISELKGDELSGEYLKLEKQKLAQELIKNEESFKNIENAERHFQSLFTYFQKHKENENKKLTLKNEMTRETTRLNQILKSSEDVFNLYQEKKAEHAFKIPKFQVSLKKEQELKNLEENINRLTEQTTSIKSLILNAESEINHLAKERDGLLQKLESIQIDIYSPINLLRNLKGESTDFFETYTYSDFLKQEFKNLSEKSKESENTIKELSEQIEKCRDEINEIPKNILEIIESKTKERKTIINKKEELERARIQFQETSIQIQTLESGINQGLDKLQSTKKSIQEIQTSLRPIEATLKLQAVINASEICIEHALMNSSKECPVCHTDVTNSRWIELKSILLETDLKAIREKQKVLIEEQTQLSNDEKLLSMKLQDDEKILQAKKNVIDNLIKIIPTKNESTEEIDQEIERLKKSSWKLDILIKEIKEKEESLSKATIQNKKALEDLSKIKTSIEITNLKLQNLIVKFKDLIPIIDAKSIAVLKNEFKLFSTFSDTEVNLSKVVSELEIRLTSLEQLHKRFDDLETEKKKSTEKCQILKDELSIELNGEKASVLIHQLQESLNKISDSWSRQQEEQKKQELILKDSNARISQLEELSKDFELQFTSEKFLFNEATHKNCGTEINKLGEINLNLNSPHELFIPLQELLKEERSKYRILTNETRMNFASISTKLFEWEKIQDKIQLFELKLKELSFQLSRKMRLFDVLGKDELRTFVLALVEESLIHQTNEELQKLCQGRYEIIHQTKTMKMAPEFYILDKFREGGKRKISTLSGGETFMVSLAMALGLAEMTRGQAEIDSLFIDEGFGTLDQESLEDVLNMLQQIQTRGLTVGIISHIKTLTNALPVNLVLSKKADGTSSISLRNN